MKRADDLPLIKAGLRGDMLRLAQTLYPNGRRDGARYWPASSKTGKRDGSLCIDIAGPNVGRWKDFADDAAKGDPFSLIAFAVYGLYPPSGFVEAIAWARGFLGLPDPDSLSEHEQKSLKAKAKAAKKEAAERAIEAERERRALADEKAKKAANWWIYHALDLRGTPGEAYLRARGIVFEELRRWPGAIRFAPRLKYADENLRAEFPGLVTAMTDARGSIRAVHLTYLDHKKPAKAPVQSPKKMFGDPVGSSIRIARGVSALTPEDYRRRIEAGKAKAQDHLAILEGIEDALTWAMIAPDARVCAAGSLALIAKAPLFDCASTIEIIGDRDENETARRQLLKAAQTIRDRSNGRSVTLTIPEGAKDVNDAWRGTA